MFLDRLSRGGVAKILQPSLQIFVFFELLRTVAPLECEVCSDIGTSCSGNLKTCDALQDTCVIILIHNTLDGKVLQTVAKGCESRKVCKTPNSLLNMGHGKILHASLVCCTKDACKTAKPQLPPAKMKMNGKQCPGCYSEPGSCNEEMVNCSNTEDYCFDMFSRSYGDGMLWDSVMKGCTTLSTCRSIDREQMSFLKSRNTVIITFKCSPATSKGVHFWKFSHLIVAGFLFQGGFF